MSLELKKKKLELIKVQAAQAELEFRIEEKLEEIERIKAHIQVQIDHAEKLKLELENK